MKILVAGDCHGSIAQIMYLIQIARNQECEKIFVLGDFGAWEHMPDGVAFFNGCNTFATESGIPIYWLRGNHDKSSLVEQMYQDRDEEGFILCRPGLKYAPDGLRWTWGGVRFLSFGGAYSVDKDWRLAQEAKLTQKIHRVEGYRRAAGRPPKTEPELSFSGWLWFPEEEASDCDVEHILSDPTGIDILLTHDKPVSSSPGWNRKHLPECQPNAQRVQKIITHLYPALNLHGHLHYRYTDHILTGSRVQERTYCSVEGLQADPAAAGHLPGYQLKDSWLVLEVCDGEWDLHSD
jgi:predicted phosphodiesterase